MPEIETKNEMAKGLKGLNLFHFGMSNCSQRARLALEEKGHKWTSHHMDMMKGEHATPEYQSINPNGVVPTLVHDGRTIIESLDIIAYADEIGEGPSLTPDDPALAAEMRALFDLADKAQPSVKLLSHEFLFKPVRKMSPKQLDEMRRGHSNKALVDFLEEFSAGFSRERIEQEVQFFCDAFDTLEASLTKHGGPWLLGEQFTLADLAWIVNVHRVKLMRWDFKKWPTLMTWIKAMEARPAYDAALRAWEPRGVLAAFGIYTRAKALFGGGVNSYRP